jgi:hypothetical protein
MLAEVMTKIPVGPAQGFGGVARGKTAATEHAIVNAPVLVPVTEVRRIEGENECV